MNKNKVYSVVPKEVIFKIIEQFNLNIKSPVHGLSHWSRVIDNAFLISKYNYSNIDIAIVFGFFHDSKRFSDSFDYFHGMRGAKYLESFRDKINLNKEDFNKCFKACDRHTDTLFINDIDISTCWDSDRLDLGRVGLIPNIEKLNNKNIIVNNDLIKERTEIAKSYFVPEWSKSIMFDYYDFKGI